MKIKLTSHNGFPSMEHVQFPIVVNATKRDEGLFKVYYSEVEHLPGFNHGFASDEGYMLYLLSDVYLIDEDEEVEAPVYMLNDASFVHSIVDTRFKRFASLHSTKKANPDLRPRFIPTIEDDKVTHVVVKVAETDNDIIIPGKTEISDFKLTDPISVTQWHRFMILEKDFVPCNNDIEDLRKKLKELMSAVEEATIIKEEAKKLYKTNPEEASKLFKKSGKTVTPVKHEIYAIIDKIEQELK